MKLKLENFLAIKKAEVESNDNIIILLSPNRGGKTQILLLLYTVFWTLWKNLKDTNKFVLKENQLKKKLIETFLITKLEELISWEHEHCYVSIDTDFFKLEFTIKKNNSFDSFEFHPVNSQFLSNIPIYLQPSGLGDYYKGIYSLKKYYSDWKIITSATTDFINDLFIVSDGTFRISKSNENLLKIFENLFNAKFYIQNQKIYIIERKKKYGIEKTASGLKTLSWLYLIIKYNLIGNILFLDEPEANLHPQYIDNIAYFLYKLSQSRKIFIATHSDYLLESFNKLITQNNFKINVWNAKQKNFFSYFDYYQVDNDNLIDTSPLVDIYFNILKEGFGYE